MASTLFENATVLDVGAGALHRAGI